MQVIDSEVYDFREALKSWMAGGVCMEWTPSAMEGSYEDHLRALFRAHLQKIVPVSMPLALLLCYYFVFPSHSVESGNCDSGGSGGGGGGRSDGGRSGGCWQGCRVGLRGRAAGQGCSGCGAAGSGAVRVVGGVGGAVRSRVLLRG